MFFARGKGAKSDALPQVEKRRLAGERKNSFDDCEVVGKNQKWRIFNWKNAI
jgi:hypothetical protein